MKRYGEKHHRAKISSAMVRDMRSLYQSWKAAGSPKGYGALAELFGCSEWTARDIVTYRTRVYE
jgi:hypothetical protein